MREYLINDSQLSDGGYISRWRGVLGRFYNTSFDEVMTGKTQSIVQNNRVTVENEGQLFQSTETLCNMHRGPMILRGSHV